MTHHKAYQQSHQPPCWQEQGSTDARFVYCVGETTLLLSTEQLKRHEADFTLPLHRVLHPQLHLSRKQKLSRMKKIDDFGNRALHAARNWGRRERPHPLPHGASRVPWGRSRLVVYCTTGPGRVQDRTRESSRACFINRRMTEREKVHGNPEAANETAEE
jgi:hypothetical protein